MDVRVLDLRYFVAVAEELSFTRAAGERLFVSQPALSKQIRSLEKSLRVRLFDPDRRSVRLTAAGAALLPRARSIIEQWDEARREVGAAESTLTVGFQTRIGRGLIPSVTSRMGELLPEWRLRFRQVSWSDPTAGVGGGEVDVAIAWLPLPDRGDLTWRVVSTEDRWVALPSAHRLTAAEVVPFEELLDEPFVALPTSSGELRAFWLAEAQRPRPARVATEAATSDETFEAVASGLGVVLLASGNVAEREDVVYRPVVGLPPSELAVVWRAADRRVAVRVFVESCVRCLCA
ncbi:LysR family transcriptional regulator [Umezawaea endophytica]|uniref:LysR family transcriptional regulator n=1 Tax=Umezawaea endophytica TaxID=1654476 RepID=A0A9X2VRE4_9PSEU|nr:LysR family transcriptional regulator [Umezawaea endophytica]MCS7481503.1 LysR family transcriptional regulator [Umezawaea endophytica]